MKLITTIFLTFAVPFGSLLAQGSESDGYEKTDVVITTHIETTYTEYNIVQKTTITATVSCTGTGSEACVSGTTTETVTAIYPRHY